MVLKELILTVSLGGCTHLKRTDSLAGVVV